MSGQPLDVTAIVVAYKSEDRIVEAIASHERALAHLDAEILVVDNASGDRTVELARSALRRGRVIANLENVGYGAAANQAISEAKGKTCLILNDDARFDREAIDVLLETLHSSEEVALVGPRIVDELGAPMPSARLTFPGPSEEWGRAIDIVTREDTNSPYPDAQQAIDVAWLVGACILGKTDVLRKAGGFNPEFFLYAEDIDLCRRLHEMGYRIVTVPPAICVHTGSVSTGAAYGRVLSIKRRAAARSIYYRIWQPRPVRSLTHLRRAFGFKNQPARLVYHLPRVIWDGPSLKHARFPGPLPGARLTEPG